MASWAHLKECLKSQTFIPDGTRQLIIFPSLNMATRWQEKETARFLNASAAYLVINFNDDVVFIPKFNNVAGVVRKQGGSRSSWSSSELT
jgi:hypothetical protein